MDELERKTNRLQLTDSTTENSGNSKGKQRADRVSDEELAWTLYRQEQEDEKLAASIASRSISSRGLQTARGYEYALQLQNYDAEFDNGDTEVFERYNDFQRQADFITRESHAYSGSMAESSAQAAKRVAQKVPPKTAACVACMEVFAWKELAAAPCGHTYFDAVPGRGPRYSVLSQSRRVQYSGQNLLPRCPLFGVHPSELDQGRGGEVSRVPEEDLHDV
ncbi:hypothetical protein KC318_g5756 [Hortaea werneckii]|nr:hypothetical protein KC334_g2071 [Hortaea werneckii]KAI7009259.1 hypothetical protein KC355_g6622 [Hortaea werneckii]KAI7201701.1 hypothetical protein KC324_g2085 [Hortaea werneckii]KAI7554018.1 hypothetical protein KC331_g834 [Hortaea werneckii]KAI7593163.1 hypothetical protein KC316_g1912 [Hortaea werneckii]